MGSTNLERPRYIFLPVGRAGSAGNALGVADYRQQRGEWREGAGSMTFTRQIVGVAGAAVKLTMRTNDARQGPTISLPPAFSCGSLSAP